MFEMQKITGTIKSIVEYGGEDDFGDPWMECMMEITVIEGRFQGIPVRIENRRNRKKAIINETKVHFTIYDPDIKVGSVIEGKGFFAHGNEPQPDQDLIPPCPPTNKTIRVNIFGPDGKPISSDHKTEALFPAVHRVEVPVSRVFGRMHLPGLRPRSPEERARLGKNPITGRPELKTTSFNYKPKHNKTKMFFFINYAIIA